MAVHREEDGGLGYPGGTNQKALEPFGQRPLVVPEKTGVEIGFPERPSAFVPQSYE